MFEKIKQKFLFEISNFLLAADSEQLRENVCNTCESKKVILGADVCSECGCLLKAKRSIKTETCPRGKW